MCGERITWLALCLSLSLSPVAGVWWAHTLDWLYVSLSSPPVAGVWSIHLIGSMTLSSPPVSWGVVKRVHLIGNMRLSLLCLYWCVVSASHLIGSLDWLYVSLLPPLAGCGESIHLIGTMTLSSPPVAGVWWAHTLDWHYDSLSSAPVAGVWQAHSSEELVT